MDQILLLETQTNNKFLDSTNSASYLRLVYKVITTINLRNTSTYRQFDKKNPGELMTEAI